MPRADRSRPCGSSVRSTSRPRSFSWRSYCSVTLQPCCQSYVRISSPAAGFGPSNGLPIAGCRGWDMSTRLNHSRQFVDPVTGAHTNNVEARWNACKATMKRRYGVPREQVPAYLDEYMWRCRRSPSDVFLDILEAMRRRYPC